MTQTTGPVASATSTSDPRTRVDSWLASFESALAARDVQRAAAMFAVDGYWRDLVSFTWNIKTVEGRDGVADMLHACLDATDPTGFRTTEEPVETDGVTEAWIEFETATGRGSGHLRLTDEGAWTLLTSLRELKGCEEPQGERRPKGVHHGSIKGRRSWAEERELDAAQLGYERQPYVVVIGGAGRHRPRRAPSPVGCAGAGPRTQRPRRRLLAEAVQESLPARPGLVRPPSLPPVPRQLAGLRTQGQDR